jgi:UDP-N-acetylglucosamine--N-acetylmuramyl-(pentapeptide) pyrophosphoryl-undecaprenol N-acetylglucosamine transferase
MMSKKILFTGGGSAGHVSVNVALIPEFIKMNWDIVYVGSYRGIESELIAPIKRVQYIGISSGKLRRYVDLENLKDPFRIVKGVLQAYRIIRREKPGVVFSKGGFVSVPVVLGAWLNRVPVIIHESDLSPGLANKLALPMAAKVCLTFPETKQYIASDKAVHVGAIIREQLKEGKADRGYALCGFTRAKSVILVMGGSLGSKRINEAIRGNLVQLLGRYQIIHLCGKGGRDDSLSSVKGYKQFEYVQEELPDLLAMASMVISRAGSNSIFEFLALRIPMLLIPLSLAASRGDQILNAKSFKESGYCEVLAEEDLNPGSLWQALTVLEANRERIIAAMAENDSGDPLHSVIELIQSVSK